MSQSTIRIERSLPVRHEVDIFIAGGGPAGCAAAVAAARQGKSVFLAEGQACLGGMGTSGLVPAFMQFGDGVNFLAAGFGEELLDRLIASGGTTPPADPAHRTGGYSIRAEVLKRVYDDMLQEAGAEFTFHTHLIGVEAADGRVQAALLWGKSGLFAVRAKVFIDGTGDGDLAAWAGAPFEKGDAEGTMMPGTLCSLWANADVDAYRRSGIGPQNKFVEQAYQDGVFSYCDKHLPGMWKISDTVGGGNIGHTFGVDATDERSLTEALLWGRKSMLEYEAYYKRYLQGFEGMELVATGALLGVRESRRILGDYVLCLDDFQHRATFADEIGRYSYPVDIHVSRPNDEADYQRFVKEISEMRYGKGESYGIPYRSLVPRELTNVLVAGRCLSADRFLQGSVRVMPGCYITGQAVGMAAALAVDAGNDVRAIAIEELQRRLRGMGAYLP
ncbi:MAG: FAD-dependent oxidoreductase [Armatimonadota bacterium]